MVRTNFHDGYPPQLYHIGHVPTLCRQGSVCYQQVQNFAGNWKMYLIIKSIY